MKQSTLLPIPAPIGQTFVVRKSDLDKNKQLSVCAMLQIVTALKDEALVQLLGVLDYDRIRSSRYELQFPAKAGLNEALYFEATTSAPEPGRIRIAVSAAKASGKKQQLVLSGYFIFELPAGREEAFFLQEEVLKQNAIHYASRWETIVR